VQTASILFVKGIEGSRLDGAASSTRCNEVDNELVASAAAAAEVDGFKTHLATARCPKREFLVATADC
jgi:hypothetical protein